MNKKTATLVKITTTALLIAVTVFLNRFLSVMTADTKIGFAFVPIMICGMLYGPLWGAACGGLGDLVAAILIPYGPPHLGITLTAAITGALYGLLGLLAARQKNGLFVLSSVSVVLVEKVLCTLLLNSFWLSGITGLPLFTQMYTRLPQAAILFIPEVILALVTKNHIIPPVRRAINKMN